MATKWLMGGELIQCGYARQRGESCPGWNGTEWNNISSLYSEWRTIWTYKLFLEFYFFLIFQVFNINLMNQKIIKSEETRLTLMQHSYDQTRSQKSFQYDLSTTCSGTWSQVQALKRQNRWLIHYTVLSWQIHREICHQRMTWPPGKHPHILASGRPNNPNKQEDHLRDFWNCTHLIWKP